MKRVVLFYLAIHLFELFPIVAFGQWEREGELEKVRASGTILLKYVLPSDGKSILALDYKYNLRKIDMQTGETVWEKELKNRTFKDKPLEGARIGMEGENYVLYYLVYADYWADRKLFFFVFDIENDSLILTIEYAFYPDLAHFWFNILYYQNLLNCRKITLFMVVRLVVILEVKPRDILAVQMYLKLVEIVFD
ncbi:hypothetical protein D9V84_03800 [Bacteroidetes/Chlorobi group bacterium Naka2016]|jgi:hypothetical protein|nr:MAG: hypothetical protein D9V84_03800 [Bacteroidetes/Chlorobi group bacterium Naka2016]